LIFSEELNSTDLYQNVLGECCYVKCYGYSH